MTARHKNIALIIGFILLFFLAYVFSFSKTLEARKQLKAAKQEALLLENSSTNLGRLIQKDKYLDSILASKRIDTKTSFQQHGKVLLSADHF